MKIAHICLASFYIDDYSYQENLLPLYNKKMGHDVKIIASTEVYIDNKNVGYLSPRQYVNKYNIEVVRLPYISFIPHKIAVKFRAYEDTRVTLEDFAPDVILFHGIQSWDLLTVAQYKRKHPQVKLYVDAHSAYYNSAKTFLSRNMLHKVFYKYCIHKSLDAIDKVFSVGFDITKFIQEIYDVPIEMIEDYPLGGIIPSAVEYVQARERIRNELKISGDQIMLVHTGKMDKLKKTEELLDALHAVQSDKLRLIIIGSLSDEVKHSVIDKIARDSRVQFLGWKDADELMKYLMACDLYCQPGSVSATMQNAICCGAAVMVAPHPDYTHLLEDAPLYADSTCTMEKVFRDTVAENSSLLADKKRLCNLIAHEKLDYKKLAARLYE